jgi:hypothetical protein
MPFVLIDINSLYLYKESLPQFVGYFVKIIKIIIGDDEIVILQEISLSCCLKSASTRVLYCLAGRLIKQTEFWCY